jgi:hypothetical protein
MEQIKFQITSIPPKRRRTGKLQINHNNQKGEIPNNKLQITNKFQHAAQAPALRVTEKTNNKQKNKKVVLALVCNLVLVVWNFLGIWCL